MNVPEKQADRIAYYYAHVQPWTSHAADIGVEETAVTEFAVKVTGAQASLNAAVAAREASKAATEQLKIALAEMDEAGSALTRTIRAFAVSSGDETVYVKAEIPAPREPSPQPAPGEPYKIEASLSTAGILTLRWKCENPAGSGGGGGGGGGGGEPFMPIGYADKKEFVDTTLSPTSPAVEYQIEAVRSGKAGSPARFTVSLGAAVPSQTALRVAA